MDDGRATPYRVIYGVLNWYLMRNDVSPELRDEIIRGLFGGRNLSRRDRFKLNLIRLLARGNTVVVNADVRGELGLRGRAVVIDSKIEAPSE
jgi:hypothetical protein